MVARKALTNSSGTRAGQAGVRNYLENPYTYARLGPEFELINELVAAQSVIARLEGGRSAPTWKTLSRYAEATGRRLRVNLEER